MINKVGYGDNRTSFGSYFKLDSNGNIDKLYNLTSDVIRTTELARTLRKKTPNHVLEVVHLTEGTTQRVKIRNNSTGEWVSYSHESSSNEMLPNLLNHLLNLAKKNSPFWDETSNRAKLYRLLTGQKDSTPTI